MRLKLYGRDGKQLLSITLPVRTANSLKDKLNSDDVARIEVSVPGRVMGERYIPEAIPDDVDGDLNPAGGAA